MVVRLRLARFGAKGKPFYRITANDSKFPRDGRHIEQLGYYDPLKDKRGEKRMAVDVERVKYWLSVGAQPSDPVERLLVRAGVLPAQGMFAVARKETRQVDPMTGRLLVTWVPSKHKGPIASDEVVDKADEFVDEADEVVDEAVDAEETE